MACEEYVKTNWVNGTAPAINADNLNNMERGIEDVTVCSIDNANNIEIIQEQLNDSVPTGIWWYDEVAKVLHISGVPTVPPAG